METICCICKTPVASVYSSIDHLEDGSSRIYNGHKRCLFSLRDELAKGEEVPYEEFYRKPYTPKKSNK